ncbi:MAG: sigma-70 family RNA polymerase sigma factor [Candidatus Omnitrophica bacterium]|nr:sigma-70 family RNA polymerase sigma factor [Candidatus Omnitrophota bacterium]
MDDKELINRCIRLDKEAQQIFIEKYCRLIYSIICNFFRNHGLSVSVQTIEDLYQEVITCLIDNNFKKLSSFKGKNGASLASWLRQVVVNRCIDYLRKLRPQVLSLDEPINEDGFSLSSILSLNSLSVSELANENEKMADLADCIERLSVDEKFFLEMHLNQGMSLNQIKDFYNISRAAVDMRKARIVERLRDCFRKKGYSIPILK